MRAWLSIAGVTTLLFLAGPARATIYQFQIVPDASPLSTVVYLSTGSGFARFDDVVHSYGEPNPSNAAKATGSFSADITPGASIAFQSGANITFPTAYAYLPSTVPAQLGFEISLNFNGGPFSNGGYGYAYASGITMGFGDGPCASLNSGGSALAHVGGNSYAGSNNTLCGTGSLFEFSSSALGNGGAYGFLLPFGFSSNIVSFDGTTIVIPVNSTRTEVSGGNVLQYVTSGSLVAQVVAVPEPSSLLLVGGGTLVLAGLRARPALRRSSSR